ncbi:MAG: hypothetical protein ACI8RD_003948 [Bacillariaceae sp.]|jgi:hypothetical protein
MITIQLIETKGCQKHTMIERKKLKDILLMMTVLLLFFMSNYLLLDLLSITYELYVYLFNLKFL